MKMDVCSAASHAMHPIATIILALYAEQMCDDIGLVKPSGDP